MSDDRMIEEQALRRALRLEADEVPPRLDVALIAAAARSSGPRPRDLALATVVAFVGGWVASAVAGALGGLAQPDRLDVLGLAISGAAALLVRLAPAWELARQPAVPLAIAAMAVLALAYERRRISA